MPERPGRAPAKVNLVLEVTGRRPDGYHDLRSVMQALELADVVTLTAGHRETVTVTGPFADGTPADASNLAWRAMDELARRCGRTLERLALAIDKRIPTAAGLGGGASDAATALRLLADHWAIEDEDLLLEAANAVGSDEAFFLHGATALVEGRGERVTPLPPLPAHDVVLFVPAETLEQKTGTLFAALADTPYDEGQRTDNFLRGHPQPLTVAETYNAFERVAFEAFPGLARLREGVERAIESPVRLAGAGPTLFWIGAPGEGERTARQARGLPCRVIPTRTAP